MSNITRGRVPLEEIPAHYEGDKVTLADAQLSRVIEEVEKHLPFDVLTDLEDAFGELILAAFEYGTRCEPGDDPLLSSLSEEEFLARTGELHPRAKAKAAGAEARAAGKIAPEDCELIERLRLDDSPAARSVVDSLEMCDSQERVDNLRRLYGAD